MTLPERHAATRPPRARPAAPHLVALALVAALGLVAAALAVVSTDGASGLVENRVLRLAQAALAILVVVGAVRRAIGTGASVGPSRGERLTWVLLGVLGAVVCVALLALAHDPSRGGRLVGPLALTIPQMLVAPLVVGGVLVASRPVRNRIQAVRITMDGAAIAASTIVLGWYIAVRPLRDAVLQVDVSSAVAMAYLVLDAVAFSLGLLALSRAPLRLRRIVAIGVVGLALLLFADVSRIVQYLPGRGQPSALSELGWTGALACFGVAAWSRQPPLRVRGDEPVAGKGWPWWLTLPYTFLVPVAAVLVVSAVQHDTDGPMVVGAAAIITVLGFRHVIALRENEELTTRLRGSVLQLAHRAEHDELTGLLNRSGLIDRLDRLRSDDDRPGEPVALLFIDIDRFKGINDTLGHGVGDAVLHAIGVRLDRLAGENGLAARFAGDEFVLLFPGMGAEHAALRVAQDALDAVEQPIALGEGGEIVVTASAGVAITDELADGETVVREADLAMFEAKSGGRARVQLFEEDLRERSEDRMRIEQEMRRSLQGSTAFEVHLQPLVLLNEQDRLWGAEALVRWRHPSLGMILPGRFLPVAEESGMIVPLGDMILAEACAAAVAVPGLTVSVNVSPRQIHDPMLVRTVRQQLEVQGLAPGRLCLEVTEEVLVDTRTIAVLEDIQALGVRVAIDDFGIGASSLRQLRRIPGALVKIDRSFLERIDGEAGADDRVLVKALVTIADQLGLEVVAEGIERPSQLEVVRDLGVTIGQGWLLGAPKRSAAFVTERGGRPLLRRHARPS